MPIGLISVLLCKIEMDMNIEIEINGPIEEAEVIELYRANDWSSADNSNDLIPALRNSGSVANKGHSTSCL